MNRRAACSIAKRSVGSLVTRLVYNARLWLWWCAFAALSCSARGLAQALPDPGAEPAAASEPAGYRDAIDSAIHEYEAGRFSEARALFENANNLYPNARSLRGLGMTEFELRNYPGSIYYLEQALAAPAKPLTDELRAETEELLTKARAFVGKVLIDVRPADASLRLNETLVQLASDRALTLIAGDYELKASAPGFDPELRKLHVAAMQVVPVQIELAKHVEVLAPPPRPPMAARERESSVAGSPWLWVAVGAVVAAAAVGVGFALSTNEAGAAKPSGGSSGVVLEGPR